MILIELTHSFSYIQELPFKNIRSEKKKKSMIDSLTGLADSATKSPIASFLEEIQYLIIRVFLEVDVVKVGRPRWTLSLF